MKEKVKGIIIILSCQRYKYSRLNEFKLKKNNYDGYKVIYVLGDNRINEEYILEDDILTINCEDSYIHLLKKLVLALKYVYQFYDIEEGVLRSGDDLYFNESKLFEFINTKNKNDFIGNNWVEKSLSVPHIDLNYPTRDDYFMVKYYENHKDDLINPLHNLKNVNIINYIKRPTVDIGACGTLYYISNKCCKILIDHMEKINFDIFHFDKLTKSYPYTIEDCAVSFILYLNKIPFVCDKYFVKLYENRPDDGNYIASHTNKYRNEELKSINLENIEKIVVNKSIIINDKLISINEPNYIDMFYKSTKKLKKYKLSAILLKNEDIILKNFDILFNMVPSNFDILCVNSKNIKENTSLNFSNKFNNQEHDVFIVSDKFCKLYCALIKYLKENSKDKDLSLENLIYNLATTQGMNVYYC
jgi:hypothetical protein